MRSIYLFNMIFAILTGLSISQPRTTRPTPSRTSANTSPRPNPWSARPTTPINTSTTPSPSRPVVNTKGLNIISDEIYGKYLANEVGYTFYANTAAKPDTVTCLDDCLKIFTPAIVQMNDSIRLHDNLVEDKLAFIKRPDGTTQMIYNKQSLFYFKNDTQAGEYGGQGYNGTWYMLNEKGIAINPSGSNMTNSNTTSPTMSPPVTSSDPDTSLASSTISSGKKMTVPGFASLVLIPDRRVIYVKVTSNNTEYISTVANVESGANEIRIVLSRVNTDVKMSFFYKEKSFINGTYSISNTYIVVADDESVDKAISPLTSLQNNSRYSVSMTFGNTVSEVTANRLKKQILSTAMRNAMDNATNMAERLKFEIHPRNPISSIKIEQTLYPTYLGNSDNSFYFTDRMNTNIITSKISIDYNILTK